MKIIDFNKQLVDLESMLNRFAYKLTANREDAKDLMQDTFLKALIHHQQFEDSSNLKAWTYTIMKNAFINNYRRNERQNTTLDRTKDLFFLAQNRDTFNMVPDEAYGEKEIRRAINSLDNGLRTPFNMYIQGYKYREIADILDMNIGTVKSRIFFSRKKLAELLPGYK